MEKNTHLLIFLTNAIIFLVLISVVPIFGQSKTGLEKRVAIESQVHKTKGMADSLLNLPFTWVEKSQNKIDSLTQIISAHSLKTAELSTNIHSPVHGLEEKFMLADSIPNLRELVNELDIGSSLDKVTTEIGNYKNDFTKRSKGNIEEVKAAPEYLENKIKNAEGISTVESHQSAMDAKVADVTKPEGLGDMEKLGDKEYLKEQAMPIGRQAVPIGRQALQQLKKNVDHFAKHADKIKAAQGKLAKLKRKYSSLESMKNPPKGKRNALKGETLGERLTIGGNFQLYKTAPFGVDVSPQLAYQLTKKFSVGIGGTYRTGIDKEKDFLFTKEKEAYGFRAYSEHEVYKSLYAHGEFERLHEQANQSIASDLPTTQWNSNALIGIGKTYNFTKGIKGNVMVLYNFLNDKTDPYRRPWNIRFGFVLKNKKNRREAITSNKQE